MTRANLNFLFFADSEDESKREYKVLFNYHNGDQYPTGLKHHYNILDFLKSDWTPETFTEWIKKNYQTEPEETDQPKIYYTGGFITDYSYVFDYSLNEKKVLVYQWAKKVFDGTADEFAEWIDKQEQAEDGDNDRFEFKITIETPRGKSDIDTVRKQIEQTFDEEVKAEYWQGYEIN